VMTGDGVAQPKRSTVCRISKFFSISLDYIESRREDEYGEPFRYKARITRIDPREEDSRAGKVIYDLFMRIINDYIR
jgi:hypothetical protein